jgi:hypothetical protein
MVKSFSSRYTDYLLEKVHAIKPAAADYIANIDDLWQSTDSTRILQCRMKHMSKGATHVVLRVEEMLQI